MPRGTQVPYPTPVDLAEEYGVSQNVHSEIVHYDVEYILGMEYRNPNISKALVRGYCNLELEN